MTPIDLYKTMVRVDNLGKQAKDRTRINSLGRKWVAMEEGERLEIQKKLEDQEYMMGLLKILDEDKKKKREARRLAAQNKSEKQAKKLAKKEQKQKAREQMKKAEANKDQGDSKKEQLRLKKEEKIK